MSVERIIALIKSRTAADEFIVTENYTREFTQRSLPTSVERTTEYHRYHARIFRDLERGRGESTVEFTHEDLANAGQRLADANARAEQSLGPSWFLPLAAAPAEVDIEDPDLTANPATVMKQLASKLRADAADTQVTCSLGRTTVVVSTGFNFSYKETSIVAQRGQRRIAARRQPNLDLNKLKPTSVADAQATPAGRYDLIFDGSAIDCVHLAPHGLLTPVAEQADATRYRRGMSRFAANQPLWENPELDLQITSDGTLPFAPRSRPFAADGSPTRNFDLVREGRVVGLALNARDAALLSRTPNGGVRTLRMNTGSARRSELVEPTIRPTLAVHELQWLTWDADTGVVSFAIAAATRRGAGGETRVTGGVVSGNVFQWIAQGKRSVELYTGEIYRGPDAIRAVDVAVY